MKTFNEWLKEREEIVDEGILQDLGNSKFVRNAVTAAGLGAAALGGYGLKGMQGSKSGGDFLGNRAVASARVGQAKMVDDRNDVPMGDENGNLDPKTKGLPVSINYIRKYKRPGFHSDPNTILMIGREGGAIVIHDAPVGEVKHRLEKMGFNVEDVIKNQGAHNDKSLANSREDIRVNNARKAGLDPYAAYHATKHK